MKNLSYEEMQLALEKRFPSLVIHDSSVFSSEYEPNTSLWLRNASEVTYTEKDLNPISALDNRIYESKQYDLDVYIKFYDWCIKRGWYATTEDYTLMLIKL